MNKTLPKDEKRELKRLLSHLRSQYNLYVDDDKEVIDAIDILTEEIEYNVKDREV